MVLKTELHYPWIYSVLLNKDDWNYSYAAHKSNIKKCRQFEQIYKKNISKSIKLIEKHTKIKKWLYEFIPINIVFLKKSVYKKVHSFANPLTLKYRNDSKEMFYVLIHELIHNNLNEKEQIIRGLKENEKLVWEITNKVWNDLNLGEIPNN